ncbi:unnamed protein product [Diamesa tonsa]
MTAVKFPNELNQFGVVRAGSYNWIQSLYVGHSQRIVVKRKSIYCLRIKVRAKKFGNIDFTVQATTPTAGDMIKKSQYLSFLNTIVKRWSKEFELECEIVGDPVNDTILVQSAIVGDIKFR